MTDKQTEKEFKDIKKAIKLLDKKLDRVIRLINLARGSISGS